MTEISAWEANEKAMEQTQTERREKLLVFEPDFIFSLLMDLMSGRRYIVQRPDGKQSINGAVENALPEDARLARVDLSVHNTRYDADRDSFVMRVVSKEFESVDANCLRPELPPVVFYQRSAEEPFSLLSSPPKAAWVLVPADGLEVIVDKARFEVASPKEWPESENEVRVLIRPKS